MRPKVKVPENNTARMHLTLHYSGTLISMHPSYGNDDQSRGVYRLILAYTHLGRPLCRVVVEVVVVLEGCVVREELPRPREVVGRTPVPKLWKLPVGVGRVGLQALERDGMRDPQTPRHDTCRDPETVQPTTPGDSGAESSWQAPVYRDQNRETKHRDTGAGHRDRDLRTGTSCRQTPG